MGAAEYNLENYKDFRTVNAEGAKLYQKLAPRPAQPEVTLEPSFLYPLPVPAQPAPANAKLAEPRGPHMEGLLQLADRGEWQGAAEYGQKLLTQDRLNPPIHFYQALIFENLGMPEESERSLRRAIYLDRKFALAHYHLGLALKRGQQPREALRCFRNVAKALAGMPEDAMVMAGPGVSVAALKELAKMHLETASSQEAHG